MTEAEEEIVAFAAYVKRSLKQRRRRRDRPSEKVLRGAKRVLELKRVIEPEASSTPE